MAGGVSDVSVPMFVARKPREEALEPRFAPLERRMLYAKACLTAQQDDSQLARNAAMSETAPLGLLTVVPAGWPLATVIEAFAELLSKEGGTPFELERRARSREALSQRLLELWVSQREEAEDWLSRCRERFASFASELAERGSRPRGAEIWLGCYSLARQELLFEALRWHGAVEFGQNASESRFSEVGLFKHRRCWQGVDGVDWHLHQSDHHAHCRELAARLVAAESQETVRRKRQRRLEVETSERRRLEAELQQSEEERRELRNRLAVAEAQVRSAQTESADLKEQREELATRTAAAESAAEEIRKRCDGFAIQLMEAKEKEASEHTKTKEHLAQAESAAAAKQAEVQRLQRQSGKAQAAELVLADRCEQLQQQLAKAEGQMQVLWEAKATYKERCRQLERGATSPRTPYASLIQQGPTPSGEAASSGQESNLTEELGYVLVEDGAASSSALSCSSWFSVQPDCFMPDAIFKIRTGGIEHFLRGRDLQKGSQVVAGDGETMVEVCEKPVRSQAKGFVRLQAGVSMLEVTAEHPVQVPRADDAMDDEEGGGSARYVEAGKLKEGNLVMLDAGEPGVLTNVEVESGDCEVLKLVFQPDLPVAVFSCPPCILSKGANRKPATRRGKMNRRRAQAGTAGGSADEERASMPNTAGTSTVLRLRGAAVTA